MQQSTLLLQRIGFGCVNARIGIIRWIDFNYKAMMISMFNNTIKIKWFQAMISLESVCDIFWSRLLWQPYLKPG